MKTYVIRRRSAWADARELEQAAARSTRVGNEEMSTQVRWIRTYVLEEADGRLGSVCIYQATGAEAIREHARRAALRADEIYPVERTVIVREDPEQNAQAA
ncbi:MAG TPA: nickel-binding protein [Gammaproteobacteria bacterium]|nr:nickel-binding protein [Gammaproteobacteria bacterium]